MRFEMMNEMMDIAPEVGAALAEGTGVVALESTIVSHGLPYPENRKQTALALKRLSEKKALCQRPLPF